MSRTRMEEQLSQLQSPVDRLWWLAQMERGVDEASIDREPAIGSERVLERLAEIYEQEGADRHPFWECKVIMR